MVEGRAEQLLAFHQLDIHQQAQLNAWHILHNMVSVLDRHQDLMERKRKEQLAKINSSQKKRRK